MCLLRDFDAAGPLIVVVLTVFALNVVFDDEGPASRTPKRTKSVRQPTTRNPDVQKELPDPKDEHVDSDPDLYSVPQKKKARTNVSHSPQATRMPPPDFHPWDRKRPSVQDFSNARVRMPPPSLPVSHTQQDRGRQSAPLFSAPGRRFLPTTSRPRPPVAQTPPPPYSTMDPFGSNRGANASSDDSWGGF